MSYLNYAKPCNTSIQELKTPVALVIALSFPLWLQLDMIYFFKI